MTDKNGLAGLFGWQGIADKIPPKIIPLESLFTTPVQEKQEIVFAVDCSGSTLYESSKAFDGKTFREIYAETVSTLEFMLPNHTVVVWSSIAKVLEGVELIKYAEAVKNKIPFTDQISGVNEGTEPANLLPLVKGKTLVLVTDGAIPQKSIEAIQHKVPTSGLGNVFLVICPHLDEYKDMYSDKQNIEIDPRNNIKLSIPQAFSNRLATVVICNYRKKAFEIIPELSAPWVDTTKPFNEQLSLVMPVLLAGDFVIKPNGHFKAFKLDKLIDWINNNPVDEAVLNKLTEMGIKSAIRQQANEQQKNSWNACVQAIFTKALDEKVKNEYKEVEVPADASMFDRLKIITQNENHKRKIEDKYREQFGKTVGALLIQKTLAEVGNIAEAKAAQTNQNVSAFKTMKLEDRFAEISAVLPVEECGLCGSNMNIFKTISIPTKLIVQLKLCNKERVVQGKKGKQQVIKMLDLDAMKEALENYPPKLHFMNLCSGCCNTCLKNCHHFSDYLYGITSLFPQNIIVNQAGVQEIVSRLIIFPFIDPKFIKDGLDPNQPQLSFARQWLRGYMADTIGLDPASDQCMLSALSFLSSLATTKENATLLFGTQKSLLSGGKFNKYPDTVGRLFVPSVKPISAEVLTQISLVQDTIEKAEIPVLPQSNKLLLLCLLERKVSRLILAKNNKETATEKLTITLHKLHKGVFTSDRDKFGITDADVALLNASETVNSYKDAHPDDVERFITYFLVHNLNMRPEDLMHDEKNLINLLNSATLQDASSALYMHEDYLDKVIKRANMTFDDFKILVPKYVAELANNQDKDKLNVLQKFL